MFGAILLGLITGIHHAMEPDHVVAISTLITREKSLKQVLRASASWGIGHTSVIFFFSVLIIIFKVQIPENVFAFFERIVGIMLLFLGIKIFISIKRNFHSHKHSHHNTNHEHLHIHDHKSHSHTHKQSIFIGAVHGLAGSGALVALITTTIEGVIPSFVYLGLFGLGSIIAMAGVSSLLSAPALLGSKLKILNSIENIVSLLSGSISILLGIKLLLAM